MAHRLSKRLKYEVDRFGAEPVLAGLTEGLEAGHLKPEEFSIRGLAEAFVEDGREWVASLDPRMGGDELTEADAVSTGHFANITGQIVYTELLQKYMAEEFVFTRRIRTIPTALSGEKIAGVTQLGDQAAVVGEGEQFPMAGINEDWIETPQTTKRGFIVPVTKEAVFFDRTNLVLERAGEVGTWLGVNKEKRAIDCVIDENTTAHRYKWRGTTYATYQGTTPWVNLIGSNALVDWTDIDAVEALFNNLVDPNTGEPIMVMADTVVVTPQLLHTADRILNATMTATHVGGYAVSGDLNSFQAPNPIGRGGMSGRYSVLTSRLLPARMTTDTTWYMGKPSEAFAYMENWPITVVRAPANNEDEFNRDIVAKFKCSERGAFFVREPRKMVKSTVA